MSGVHYWPRNLITADSDIEKYADINDTLRTEIERAAWHT